MKRRAGGRATLAAATVRSHTSEATRARWARAPLRNPAEGSQGQAAAAPSIPRPPPPTTHWQHPTGGGGTRTPAHHHRPSSGRGVPRVQMAASPQGQNLRHTVPPPLCHVKKRAHATVRGGGPPWERGAAPQPPPPTAVVTRTPPPSTHDGRGAARHGKVCGRVRGTVVGQPFANPPPPPATRQSPAPLADCPVPTNHSSALCRRPPPLPPPLRRHTELSIPHPPLRRHQQ